MAKTKTGPLGQELGLSLHDSQGKHSAIIDLQTQKHNQLPGESSKLHDRLEYFAKLTVEEDLLSELETLATLGDNNDEKASPLSLRPLQGYLYPHIMWL